MFSLSPCFKGSQTDGHNIKILRSQSDYLLYKVFQNDRTIIYLIRFEKQPTIVLSLNKNIDIINASLSRNFSLISITERFVHKNQVGFRFKIIEIQKGLVSDEKVSMSPIDALFTSTSKENNLIYYNNNKIELYKINQNFSSKKIEMVRLKVFNNILWFYYDNKTSVLSMINGTMNEKDALTCNQAECLLIENKIKNGYVTASISNKIILETTSYLPDDFSMKPTLNSRLPIYSPFNHRIFIASKCFGGNKEIYIIEQVYEKENQNCTFYFSSFPSEYKQKVCVPNVAADIPICFYQKETLLFVYAPNNFTCIIDVTNPIPVLVLLPKQFAIASCGECAYSLIEQEAILDIDNYEIFKLEISFKYPQLFLNAISRSSIFGLATICVRLSNIEFMTAILRVIEMKNDFKIAINFFKDFFFICTGTMKSYPKRSKSYAFSDSNQNSDFDDNQNDTIRSTKSLNSLNAKIIKKISASVLSSLAEFDSMFPSASKISRTRWFCQQINSLKLNDDNINKVMEYMRQQNNIVQNIRAAIDQWVAKYNPLPIWQMFIGFTIQNETIFADFPAVPLLSNEMNTLSKKFCSPELLATFAKNGLLNVIPKQKVNDQVDYWNKRFGLNSNDSETESSSSWKVCYSPRKTKSDSEHGTILTDSTEYD